MKKDQIIKTRKVVRLSLLIFIPLVFFGVYFSLSQTDINDEEFNPKLFFQYLILYLNLCNIFFPLIIIYYVTQAL